MDAIYFACDWVYPRHVDLRGLTRVLKLLDCELVSIGDDARNEAGLFYQTFGIKVQSTEQLARFIELFGREANMAEWHPISAEQYEEGALYDIDFDVPMTNEERYLLLKSLTPIISMGIYNAERAKNLSGDE